VNSDELLRPWYDRLVEDLPGLRLFDAHTHIGADDPDGFRSAAPDLVASLATVGARGVVFPMQEPGGYPAANDRVLEASAASEGRLVPFCRLDPAHDPVAELERCLAAGARGVKLHPRAESFSLADPQVEGIFAIAAERRLPVLVHAGRGIPALGRHALELSERFPDARLILAHAGICDLSWIWRHAPEHPNLFFDTAWWSSVDLLALLALVPPGQVLFASDAPYGTPLQAAVMTLRCALQVGLRPEQVVGVAGGQLERVLAGEDALDLGPAPGTSALCGDVLLERIDSFLVNAIGRLFTDQSAEEPVALARLAAEVGEDAPQAAVCRSVLALLDCYENVVAESVNGGGPQRPGTHLVVTAAGLARTPDVPLPPDPEPVSVGERSA